MQRLLLLSNSLKSIGIRTESDHISKISQMVYGDAEHTSLTDEMIDGHRYTISEKEIQNVYSVKQPTANAINVYAKPKGLWYGFGDSWVYFMVTEGLKDRADLSNYTYEVEPSANILSISTEQEMSSFTAKFGFPGETYGEYGINWEKVASSYSGIEITPYQGGIRGSFVDGAGWAQRFAWYYPWDVASGCIWDPNGIKSMTLIHKKNSENINKIEIL